MSVPASDAREGRFVVLNMHTVYGGVTFNAIPKLVRFSPSIGVKRVLRFERMNGTSEHKDTNGVVVANRTKLLGVRVTEAEMDRMKAEAAPASVSDLVRRKMGLDSPEAVPSTPGENGAAVPQATAPTDSAKVCDCGCGATACIHGVGFSVDCAQCQEVDKATEFDKLWVRRVIPGHVGAEVPLTWADHWALMERMEPTEAMERFAELQRGRKLPRDFRGWPKPRKIAWLDREWAL